MHGLMRVEHISTTLLDATLQANAYALYNWQTRRLEVPTVGRSRHNGIVARP
jgi:hypothetical protein